MAYLLYICMFDESDSADVATFRFFFSLSFSVFTSFFGSYFFFRVTVFHRLRPRTVFPRPYTVENRRRNRKRVVNCGGERATRSRSLASPPSPPKKELIGLARRAETIVFDRRTCIIMNKRSSSFFRLSFFFFYCF